MKILMLTYDFPPLLTPRSVQIAKLVKYLVRMGHQIEVVTVDENSVKRGKVDFSLLEGFISPSVKVNRVKDHGWEPLMKFLSKVLGIYRIFWYKEALSTCLKLLDAYHYDIFCTFSDPTVCHLVGFSIKRKHPNLPWLVHMADPWIDNPYLWSLWQMRIRSNILRKFHCQLLKQIERQVMKNADLVIFVSDELRDIVMRKYPSIWLEKTHVLPHCYDRELYPKVDKEENDKVILTYVGSFYKIRSPEPLLKALRLLKSRETIMEKLLIRIVGNVQENWKTLLLSEFSDIVEIINPVPYFESLKYIISSDYLLTIDAPVENSPFFPSKIADYIGSGRPIIAITPSNSCSARIIRELGYPVVDIRDIEGLSCLLENIVSNRIRFQDNFDKVCRYDVKIVSSNFINALEKLTENER